MQPVNDDMDNLFRQAANEYPLKSDGADFDKVRQQLDAKTDLPEEKQKNRKYLWLLLLLIIPLALLFHQFYTISINTTNQNDEKDTASVEKNNNDISEKKPFTANDTATGDKVAIVNKKLQNTTIINNQQSIKKQPKTLESTSKYDRHKEFSKIKNNVHTASLNKSKITISNNEPDSEIATALNERSKRYKPDAETTSRFYDDKKVKSKKKDLLAEKDLEKKPAEALPLEAVKESSIINPGNKIVDSFHKAVPAKKLLDSSATNIVKISNNQSDTIPLKKQPAENKLSIIRGVYIGVVAGPDFSTVKSNKSNGAGFNVGFIVGYRTSRHLSLETGISWNYKKYYSDGKHVSVDKLMLPTHTQIIYMDGTCGMIELPVSIRYHFNIKGKHNWYTGIGVSSLFMKKENYHYLYSRYNMEYYSQKEYTNTTNNWLAELKLNMGYELTLNKIVGLRIEPYANFPLKGLGIGKLPLFSAGANVGLTLPIH